MTPRRQANLGPRPPRATEPSYTGHVIKTPGEPGPRPAVTANVLARIERRNGAVSIALLNREGFPPSLCFRYERDGQIFGRDQFFAEDISVLESVVREFRRALDTQKEPTT